MKGAGAEQARALFVFVDHCPTVCWRRGVLAISPPWARRGPTCSSSRSGCGSPRWPGISAR